MMLLRRKGVAARLGLSLGLSLVLGAGSALSQTAKPRGHVVQPDDGPPPDQALQPDTPAQYEHANDPEQPPEPEPVSPPSVEKPVVVVAPAPPPEQPAAATSAAPAPVARDDNKPQNQLQRDTAALLRLTEELRVEIEKAGSDTLSVAAIRKADEIQKLSRNLREHLKDQEQVPVTK